MLLVVLIVLMLIASCTYYLYCRSFRHNFHKYLEVHLEYRLLDKGQLSAGQRRSDTRCFGSLIFYVSTKEGNSFDQVYITKLEMEHRHVRLNSFSTIELLFPDGHTDSYPHSIGFNISKRAMLRTSLEHSRVNFKGYYYGLDEERVYFDASATVPEEGAWGFVI